MKKSQLTLLAVGMALGTAAIGVSAANRAIQARDARAKAAAQDAEQDEDERAQQPAPGPKVKVKAEAGKAMHREMVGDFELRVTNGSDGRLFTKDGRGVASIRGLQAARVVKDVKLFGEPVVELAGKNCRDPCNPTFLLVASPGGKTRTLVEAQGIIKLEDLDGDGVPEALVDHLVRHTSEVVTLPFVIQKEKFVPGYAKFPQGVDRQVEELGKSAERICGATPEGECRDTLLALFVAYLFAEGGDLKPLVGHLKIEPEIKAWAEDEGLRKELQREVDQVMR